MSNSNTSKNHDTTVATTAATTVTADSQVWSVTELNQLARASLEQSFSGIFVEGEISDLIQHRSGHWYFTLKDEGAQLRTAMFRFQNRSVRFQPENGQQVLLTGKLSLYEPRGSYQFIAQRMEPAGLGKLQQQYDQLKQQLSEQGLFETKNKQSLPGFPRQIVVITSPQGAAITDIQTTFARRCSSVKLIVIPVAVQGEGSAQQIADAIDLANEWAVENKQSSESDELTPDTVRPDAIIVGRGGGSLEDLWAFNEAVVAHAIHRSRLPVVSAVGHESDVTIADFVADVRAATPTAAAEILSPDQQALQHRSNQLYSRLQNSLLNHIDHAKALLAALSARVKHPSYQLSQYLQRVDQLDSAMQRAILQKLQFNQQLFKQHQIRLQSLSPLLVINQQQQAVHQLSERLFRSMNAIFHTQNQRWLHLSGTLHVVSPLATLDRGYAIVTAKNGEIIQSHRHLSIGEKVTTRLRQGTFTSIVDSTAE